jgi:hypothetical protein
MYDLRLWIFRQTNYATYSTQKPLSAKKFNAAVSGNMVVVDIVPSAWAYSTLLHAAPRACRQNCFLFRGLRSLFQVPIR